MPTLRDIEMGLHRNETLLREVLANQAIIIEQGKKIMSGESDLQAAIAANGNAITAATTEINNLATQLVAAANGDSDASIETLAQQLQAQTAQLNLAVSNATNPPAVVQPNQAGAAVTSSPLTSASMSPAGQSSVQPPSTQGATQGTTASVAGTGGTQTAAISVSAASNLTPAQAATLTPAAAATLTAAHTSAMPAEAAAALTPQAAAALTPEAKAALKTSAATGKA